MAFRRLEPNPHPEPQLQPQPDTCAKRELTICPHVRAVCLADAVLCERPSEADSQSTSRGSLTRERSTWTMRGRLYVPERWWDPRECIELTLGGAKIQFLALVLCIRP